MTFSLPHLAALCGCLCQYVMAADPWELPPVRYSETESGDTIAKLAKNLAENPKAVPDSDPLGRLRFVLETLQIDEQSQILVFSKTSKQNDRISLITPRAIYHSEDAYVGYVPGGDIEVIAHDKILGPVFYLIGNGPTRDKVRITRESGECFSCHGTARTENVPGVLVRSVYADTEGFPMLQHGSFTTTHSSPIEERWGGYYVTGKSSLPHLGNRGFNEDFNPNQPGKTPQLKNMEGIIDTRRYLQPTSDIVSLMVLEHQCQVFNRINAASLQFKRFLWLRQTLDATASVEDASTREHLQHAAKPILDSLFFADEASLGKDGIEGNPDFQKTFTKRYPKCRDGRSLADFQLNTRLFKYPCSYMVYSEAFSHMPQPLKMEVMRQMKQVLTTKVGDHNQPQVSVSARVKILHILEDTLENWPKD